jgi:hypothetical protein
VVGVLYVATAIRVDAVAGFVRSRMNLGVGVIAVRSTTFDARESVGILVLTWGTRRGIAVVILAVTRLGRCRMYGRIGVVTVHSTCVTVAAGRVNRAVAVSVSVPERARIAIFIAIVGIADLARADTSERIRIVTVGSTAFDARVSVAIRIWRVASRCDASVVVLCACLVLSTRWRSSDASGLVRAARTRHAAFDTIAELSVITVVITST